MPPSLPAPVESLVLRAALGLPESVQRALLRRPVVMDGQTLAVETQMMLKLQELGGQAPLGMAPTLADSRDLGEHQAALAGGKQPIGALRDLEVAGADGPIRARLYIPSTRLGADPVPTLLFVHGGGHAVGSIESHDPTCRFLAESSGVQVLSVDYRLAPEHPFPAPVEDCFAAYRWLVENVDAVNADVTRLAVGGDSAGANLSAATAILAAEAGLPLAFQLLVYPVTDFANRSASRELFDGGGFYLQREGMEQLHRWYLPDPADDTDPLASVGLRSSLPSGLAPAYLCTAGFDPLRDEGEAYGRLLAEHGVAVEVQRFPDMIHGFFSIVGVGRKAPANAREVALKLRAALA